MNILFMSDFLRFNAEKIIWLIKAQNEMQCVGLTKTYNNVTEF